MLGAAYSEILRKATGALDKTGVCWALIGGAAVMARGRIRGTRDFDVLLHSSLKPGAQGARELIARLQDLGFAHLSRGDVHPLETVTLHRFWYPVTAAASTGVDIQFSHDPYLDSLAERAQRLQLAGVEVPVATAEDLVVLKLISFRPIDRADAIELVARTQEFDAAYVEGKAAEFGQSQRWMEVQQAAATFDTP